MVNNQSQKTAVAKPMPDVNKYDGRISTIHAAKVNHKLAVRKTDPTLLINKNFTIIQPEAQPLQKSSVEKSFPISFNENQAASMSEESLGPKLGRFKLPMPHITVRPATKKRAGQVVMQSGNYNMYPYGFGMSIEELTDKRFGWPSYGLSNS